MGANGSHASGVLNSCLILLRQVDILHQRALKEAAVDGVFVVFFGKLRNGNAKKFGVKQLKSSERKIKKVRSENAKKFGVVCKCKIKSVPLSRFSYKRSYEGQNLRQHEYEVS